MTGGRVKASSGGAPPTSATRAHRPALAGKRDQPIQATHVTPKACEAAGEPATRQKAAKLLVDESRQACPVPPGVGGGAERLVVVPHDLIEDTVDALDSLAIRHPQRCSAAGSAYDVKGCVRRILTGIGAVRACATPSAAERSHQPPTTLHGPLILARAAETAV
jgi:hypothetical protein